MARQKKRDIKSLVQRCGMSVLFKSEVLPQSATEPDLSQA